MNERFLFATRQRVQRNTDELLRMALLRFLFAARQRVQRNASLQSTTSVGRCGVSIHCSPASAAELKETCMGGAQFQRVSIRCSPASTAELASSAPRLCSRPLLFAARQRVQRNPKRDTSRTTCAFLFAARQRVQRNVNQATVPAGYVPLLFAARQRVQRNCPPDDRGPLAPPGFYSLPASEYSGT